LFSRKEPATDSTRRTRSSASEAHADDLRSRARRRLIGALALVVAAIIVVPMLIQAPPTEQPATPIVVPAIVPPTPDASLAANGLKDVDPAASGSVIDSPVPDTELDTTTGS